MNFASQCLRVLLSLSLGGTAWGATVESVPFSADTWQTVTFAKIPATTYALKGELLEAKVVRSSAILVTPWDKPRKVSTVEFEWKTDGEILVADGALEKAKKGDDARLKVALLLSGPAPFVPFFAPGWVKAIAKILKYPTDRALNLTASRHLAEGTTWESPYTSSIEHVAVKGKSLEGGWHQMRYQLPKPEAAVGLWIMADGDDTASSFTTSVRALKVTFDE